MITCKHSVSNYTSISFLNRTDAASPDAFVEYARDNPTLIENKIITFLSSERARVDCGEISGSTLSNWVKSAGEWFYNTIGSEFTLSIFLYCITCIDIPAVDFAELLFPQR